VRVEPSVRCCFPLSLDSEAVVQLVSVFKRAVSGILYSTPFYFILFLLLFGPKRAPPLVYFLKGL
jgi:hypothetical protein